MKKIIDHMEKICDLQTASEKHQGKTARFHVYENENKYYVINDNMSKPVFEADNIAACKDWYLDLKMGQVSKVGIL